MKNIKRLIISLFVFVAFLFVFSSFNAKADPVTTNSEIHVTGASVRTTGNAGIRFVGSVGSYDIANVKAYGIAIAYGEANANDIVLGATVGGKSILTATANELDGEGYFYIVLYGVPEASYAQDVTARAYVVLNDDSIVYGTTATTRNLAEVAIEAKNKGYNGGLIDAVVEDITDNYKAIRVNFFNSLISCGVDEYEKDPIILKREFIADFNRFANTSLTVSSNYNSYYNAMKSTAYNDVTDSKLYLFFKDIEMGSKWGWLLTYLDSFNVTHLSNQIKAINGDGTKTGSSCSYDLYYLLHFVEAIYNFFNMAAENGYPTKTFTSKSSYGTITSTIKISAMDYKLCKVGSNYNFSSLEKAYYNFDGFMEDASLVAAGTPYVVKAESKEMTPQFTAITYTINYYDGESNLGLSPSSYNVETSTFALPSYAKDGHTFDGWFDNAGFEGDPITQVELGSHGNKEFFAKTTETPYLNVSATFNLNGGAWGLSDIISASVPTKTVVATYYNSYQSDGYEISFMTNTSQSIYWSYIVLEKTESTNVYRIKGKANGSANLPVNYDAVISYHSACKSDYYQAVKDIYSGSNVGQYITVENIPGSSGSGKSITIKLFPTAAFTENHNTTLNVPDTLPTPYRKNYTFDGWENSYSSDIETSYPGYTTDPGSITYTAQWIPVTPVVVSLSSADERVFGLVTPTKFVKSTFTSGKFSIGGNEYSVGDELFATLDEAVRKSSANDVIYMFGGTYAESFNLRATNIHIIGPNYMIDGNDTRSTPASITGVIYLRGSNTEVNGLEFTKNVVVCSSNISINYCYISCTPETNATSWTSKRGCIVSGASSISNLSIQHCYIMAKGSNSQQTNYISLNNVTNLELRYNYITNNCDSLPGSSLTNDGMAIKYLKGTVNIYDNEFHYATNNWLMYCGTANEANAVDATINIYNNLFSRRTESLQTCTLGFVYMSATSVLTIMNNQFLGMEPSTVSTGGYSNASAKLIFKYNYVDSSYKAKIYTTVDAETDYNCYAGGMVTSGTNIRNISLDEHILADLAAVQAAYAAYLESLN